MGRHNKDIERNEGWTSLPTPGNCGLRNGTTIGVRVRTDAPKLALVNGYVQLKENGMLGQIKRYAPRPVITIRRIVRTLAFFQNELPCLELHLTDHCNLNCKGCDHYCPIVSPHYADLGQYEADMRRLAQLFRNIREIRLMGGEPLLHPDPASFITVARSNFPKSDLRFITNGILLSKAPASFWEACRNTNTTIDLSVYPPFKKRVSGRRALCDREGVNLRMSEAKSTFHAHMNLNGDSDKTRAFQLCWSRYYGPFLQGGRLYPCRMPALIHHFNTRFGTQILADPGVDIHSPPMSGQEVVKYLRRPIETCRWCSYDFVPFSWSVSEKGLPILPNDWDAATHRGRAEQTE